MKKTLLLVSTLILTAAANAADNFQEFLIQENITMTQVNSKATIKSKPDMFRTTIEFSELDRSSKDAQLDLNKKINKATAAIKKAELEYKLGNFSTYQEHKSKKHKAYQTVTIEIKDKAKLEKITTALMSLGGKVQNTVSYVSKEAKNKQYEALFEKAYKEAVKKANFIVKQMNAKNFTITNLSHHMENNYVRPMAFKTMALESAAMDTSPQIELDNSEKDISLNLNMTIAIENNSE